MENLNSPRADWLDSQNPELIPTPNTDSKTVSEILSELSIYHLYNGERGGMTEEQAVQALEALFEYVIGIAPPCEENCTPERHAYHEGAYQLTIEQEKRLAKVMGKQSKEEHD